MKEIISYPAEHLANIVINAGLGKINSTKEKEELRESLIEFIESQRKYHEICSIAEEIDFQGLVDYINNNCLEDIDRWIYCIDPEGKEKAKQNIISAAADCSRANTVEAKSKVTKLITILLDIVEDFYKKKSSRSDAVLASEIVRTVTKKYDDTIGSMDELRNGVDKIIEYIEGNGKTVIFKSDSVCESDITKDESLKHSIVNEPTIIYTDEELELEAHAVEFMKKSLGKNADGLSNSQLLERFIKTTDALITNDLRYDVPEYLLLIPRKIYDAEMYLDEVRYPVMRGAVYESYWENIDKYTFVNDCIELDIVFENKELYATYIKYHVLHDKVETGLVSIQRINAMLDSEMISIHLDSNKTIKLPIKNAEIIMECECCLRTQLNEHKELLDKLKTIENHYHICFSLEEINDSSEYEKIIDSINYVYRGVMMERNSSIVGPKTEDVPQGDMVVEEPVFIETIPEKERERFSIFNFTFESYKSYIISGKVEIEGDSAIVPVSCVCRIVN